ncbi:hypothetical protein JI664_01055 [Rhodobacter sp. NTK016B]|uniref:hypothetical protein n=1 Tax=Rhodobacter sp. NTK016B TaxID=2759676 RepID=UPI001A8E1525|nr:hypothetical protein [Rhodobacter sp. NTK016B]MBN8290542.1 hypothetical protein [Rhodobacter sp. NTK016B]
MLIDTARDLNLVANLIGALKAKHSRNSVDTAQDALKPSLYRAPSLPWLHSRDD